MYPIRLTILRQQDYIWSETEILSRDRPALCILAYVEGDPVPECWILYDKHYSGRLINVDGRNELVYDNAHIVEEFIGLTPGDDVITRIFNCPVEHQWIGFDEN